MLTDKAAVEADVQALKDILATSDTGDHMTDAQVAEIKAAKEKLMESAQKLFTKMYEQARAGCSRCRSYRVDRDQASRSGAGRLPG